MNSAFGALAMARSTVRANKFRLKKLRVRTTDTLLTTWRSSTQQQRHRQDGRRNRKQTNDSNVWNSSLSTWRDASTILMQNAKAGGKLGCLLNVIDQQVELQKDLWSSQLQFPTNDGYKPLLQIRARRLRSLLGLAYYLDEKDSESHKRVPRLCTKSLDGTLQLQVELQQMSLAD